MTMGALAMGIKEDDLDEIVQRWRQASRNIVALWHAFEKAALEAVRLGRLQVVNGIVFAMEGDACQKEDVSGAAADGSTYFLSVQLPSGRKLFYAGPQLGVNRFGRESLHYYGVEQDSRRWKLLDTYGGKLTENIVQAIARDCLGIALQRLYLAGYRIVMHVYDEVVVEDLPGEGERVCRLMSEPISWAPGLVLKAEGVRAGQGEGKDFV